MPASRTVTIAPDQVILIINDFHNNLELEFAYELNRLTTRSGHATIEVDSDLYAEIVRLYGSVV